MIIPGRGSCPLPSREVSGAERGDAMVAWLLRRVLTGGTAMRASRLRAFSRCSSTLVVVAVAAMVLAARPASPRPLGEVASALNCRTLLARAPIPETRPRQSPPRRRLLDIVSEFVERSVPDGQQYVFPTARERAGFQCGFQYAAARQIANARRLLRPLQYDVKQLIDTGDP